MGRSAGLREECFLYDLKPRELKLMRFLWEGVNLFSTYQGYT